MTTAVPHGSPRIGVVAIGRNEGERLRRCLASVDVKGAPILYVDSASTDGSPAMAAGLGAIVVDLDMAFGFTAARARNAGFEALLTRFPDLDFIQFVDGDCEFEPGWMTAAAAFLDGHPETGVVCGRRRERFPDASFYNTLIDSEWDTPVGEAQSCGGDAMIRTRTLRATGGYDPRMIAHEEPEFCHRVRKLGEKIHRIDVPMTIHDADLRDLRPWLKRNMRAGYGYMQAAMRNGSFRCTEARMLIRAAVWSLMPLLVLLLSFVSTLLSSVVALLYLLLLARQFAKLAAGGASRPVFRLFLMTMSKFAEFAGATKCLKAAALVRPHKAIYYK